MEYNFTAPNAGKFDVRICYLPHENRGTKVPVVIESAKETKTVLVDMTTKAALENNFQSLLKVDLKKDEKLKVTISSEAAGGTVHADAVQLLPLP